MVQSVLFKSMEGLLNNPSLSRYLKYFDGYDEIFDRLYNCVHPRDCV